MKKIINTTPHSLRFQGAYGSIFTVEPCGIVINAKPVETPAGERDGVTFVRTKFVADKENQAALACLEAENPDALIVGSIIAAQAFPGRVLALTPAPGFERVPVAEKLMSATKFTTFDSPVYPTAFLVVGQDKAAEYADEIDVVGVFSTKKLADDACAHLTRISDQQTEQWQTNYWVEVYAVDVPLK